MSRLDDLIAEYCPDGVEYRPVGFFARAEKGKNTSHQCELAYSITKGGLVRTSDYFKDAKVTSEDTSAYRIVKRNWFVYSPSRIDVGSINYLRDQDEVIVSPLNVVFSVDESVILPDYLLYFFQSRDGTWQIITSREGIEGTGRKLLPFDKFSKIKVPVPPLPVQREIVRILGTFTELTARKKQFEYYRHELLTFGSEIPRITLGKVGPVCMCKRILKSQTNMEGGIPFFKIGTFGKEANAYISKETFEEYKNKYSYPKKGDVLISAAGTIGRTVVFDGKPAYFQDSNIVWIDNDETKVLNEFLLYCYTMKPWAVSEGGTIPRLYNDNIMRAVIPCPSIEEQRRIVNLLHKFDALCNDISSGLPAEIAARQKQYEYYRDKLLTFKELN